MTLSYSEHSCTECNKKLLKGLYISLRHNIHDLRLRYCYECQKKIYGLNFWKKIKNEDNCFYCEIDLRKVKLFDKQQSYYIFTDMSDGHHIAFCEECFEAAAPQ